MRLLRQLALAAAAFYSLNNPVQSRVLPSGSIQSRDLECLAANCLELIQLLTGHIAKREHGSVSEELGSIFKRVPAPPRIMCPKPKPKPGSPTVKRGQTPSVPGNPKDAPPRIGSDAAPLAIGTSKPGGLGPPRIASDAALLPLPIGASKPGDPGLDLVGESKDPIQLRDKGQKVDKQAHKTSDEYKGDEIQKKFDDNYKVKEIEREGTLDPYSDDDMEPALKDLGISDMENARYRSTDVFSKIGSKDGVTEAKYFPEKGIIIGEYHFPENDMNAPGQKLNLSDLTFLQWKSSTDGKRVDRLRAFVARNVVSRSTVETMQKAQRDTWQPLDKKATFERGADTPKERDAFNMMMGTDFALGKKRIFSIWCYPRTFDGTNGEKYINIVVNFQKVK
ncbi:MAG: hypothetical protein L6R38_008574 [Xanthoria sp. 2 TBL-2021]|nr:MAG: hypothetical protein L6R38_008574 [Xanthoria sp. 2 TBL-2021]